MEGTRPEQGGQKPLSRKVLATAQSLSVDLVAAEVVEALRRAGVRSILLKGATFAKWLYRDGDLRLYTDVDLLIRRTDTSIAHAVLARLGFHHAFDSHPYFVRGADDVDLHCSLKGVQADEERVWSVLSKMTESQEVGGVEVEALVAPARALHVALHAAQHGRDWLTPMEDLRRAVDFLPFEVWETAAGLAEKIEASAAFATGLCLLPAGEATAVRLNLERAASVETVLRSKTPPPLALRFAELHAIRGLGGRIRFIVRKLFPSRAYIRFAMPVARKGPLGLVIAYCWRLVRLSFRAGPGFRAWLRARREVDEASTASRSEPHR
jgi:Uncharacterised nucleotidyltransferase